MNRVSFSNAGSWDLESWFGWNWDVLVRMLSAAGKDKTDSALLKSPSSAWVPLSWLCSLLILHCAVSWWLPVSRLHMQTVLPQQKIGLLLVSFSFLAGKPFPRVLWPTSLHVFFVGVLSVLILKPATGKGRVVTAMRQRKKARQPEPERGSAGQDGDQRSCWWVASTLHQEVLILEPREPGNSREWPDSILL